MRRHRNKKPPTSRTDYHQTVDFEGTWYARTVYGIEKDDRKLTGWVILPHAKTKEARTLVRRWADSLSGRWYAVARNR